MGKNKYLFQKMKLNILLNKLDLICKVTKVNTGGLLGNVFSHLCHLSGKEKQILNLTPLSLIHEQKRQQAYILWFYSLERNLQK